MLALATPFIKLYVCYLLREVRSCSQGQHLQRCGSNPTRHKKAPYMEFLKKSMSFLEVLARSDTLRILMRNMTEIKGKPSLSESYIRCQLLFPSKYYY